MCELSSMFLMLLFHLLLLAWVEARISRFFLSLFLVFTLRLTARLFLNLFGVRMLPPRRDYRPLVYTRSWPVQSCMLGLIQTLASLFFFKIAPRLLHFFLFRASTLASFCVRLALLHNSAALLGYFVFFLVLLLLDFTTHALA